MTLSDLTVGYALCGSFCTFEKAIAQMRALKEQGATVLPIMSENACNTDTRFGRASDIVWEIEDICGRKIIKSIVEAEPIGPKKMCDIIVVAPCTGNTLAKWANAITDTSVTMACKSHLRIGRPVLLCLATNDGLGATAKNIGAMINTKNIYFVPFSQDDYDKKPKSLVAHFEMIPESVLAAMEGKQLKL